MRHPYRTALLVSTAIALLTGCSTAQHFHLVVTVLNRADGKPVVGASIAVDSQGVEEHKLDQKYGGPRGETDDEGKVTHNLMISPYPSDYKHWYLKVSKEGFEPVVIDIKPSPQPKVTDTKTIIPLNVTVEMQPKAEPAPQQPAK